MATIAEALAIAFDHHESGRLAEAEILYGRILDADPHQASALHLLGVLYGQTDRPKLAAALFVGAIGLVPDNPGLRYDLARVRLILEDGEGAVAALRRALALQPDHAAALFQLALACRGVGRHDESLLTLERLLTLQPDSLEARYLADRAVEREGRALLERGEAGRAVARLTRPVAEAVGVPILTAHAAALYRDGRTGEAARLLRGILAVLPAEPLALCNLSLGRFDGGDAAAAERLARRARGLAPQEAETHAKLGLALAAQGRRAEAVTAARAALACDPAHAPSLSNLGALSTQLEEHDRALRLADRALRLAPDLGEALVVRGDALVHLDRPRDAEEAFRGALRVAPHLVVAHWNLAHLLLRQGDYAAGWAEFEWRWRSEALAGQRRPFRQPLWDGTDLTGRTILVHAEQGLGDTIQFVRFLDAVLRAGPARVYLEAHGPLLSLLEGNTDPARVTVIPRAFDFPGVGGLPDTDVQIPLMSLAGLFCPSLDAIPARVPYLRPDPRRAATWGERLADGQPTGGRGLRVGLVWAGNPSFHGDAQRSPRLAGLRPVLDVPGVRVFGLQKGPGREDLEGMDLPPSFTDLGPQIADVADTAAIMANLDLVISSCTGPAHLAGALGVPVWVVLPHPPDWRWLMEREDSPWYPTARLFRQTRSGDWSGPAAAVARALRRLVDGLKG
ncbi:tetratricopeptide (TPR) repeat protein [Azospirillum sp. OGB3]|uniref:tetratricopeptide repeat protein n=1 Tax=Azospirillum sp. OGB3 TaxID=2587012 RepID=UPI001606EF9D|nr:tetratricopeptide repeat protein [Azospirillum sp. OGB3]MBB3262919.1 tetratricopeptide (TPR) repeat protein [Azospirillum sp. OGB3]